MYRRRNDGAIGHDIITTALLRRYCKDDDYNTAHIAPLPSEPRCTESFHISQTTVKRHESREFCDKCPRGVARRTKRRKVDARLHIRMSDPLIRGGIRTIACVDR